MDAECMKAHVEEFGYLMKNRLIDNAWKTGWRSANVINLYAGIIRNAASLALGIEYDDLVSVRKSAADIANYAMMVVDKLESEEMLV